MVCASHELGLILTEVRRRFFSWSSNIFSSDVPSSFVNEPRPTWSAKDETMISFVAIESSKHDWHTWQCFHLNAIIRKLLHEFTVLRTDDIHSYSRGSYGTSIKSSKTIFIMNVWTYALVAAPYRSDQCAQLYVDTFQYPLESPNSRRGWHDLCLYLLISVMRLNRLVTVFSINSITSTYQIAANQNPYPELPSLLHDFKSLLLAYTRTYVARHPTITIQILCQVDCSTSVIEKHNTLVERYFFHQLHHGLELLLIETNLHERRIDFFNIYWYVVLLNTCSK